MTTSTPIPCDVCARVITARAGHHVTDDRRVLCTRCLRGRGVHARLWPECRTPGHDVFDHLRAVGSTRAGVWAATRGGAR